MTTPSIAPVLPSRNSWTAKEVYMNRGSERGPSLEVVKGIWSKYPTFDIHKPAQVAPSTKTNPNVLGLALDSSKETNQGIVATSSSMAQTNIFTGNHNPAGGGATTPNFHSTISPTSELAVDELLPTASDSMDITPTQTNIRLPSEVRGPLEFIEGGTAEAGPRQEGVSQAEHSPARRSQPLSLVHSFTEVRAALKDSFYKTVQLRHPGRSIDYEKLSKRLEEKLSDMEVRDFVRLGKEAIEQLRHSGKLEEAKRKHASEDAHMHEESQDQMSERTDTNVSQESAPRPSPRNHSRGSDTAPGAPRREPDGLKPPKSPRVMLASIRGGGPTRTPTSPRASEQLPTPRHDDDIEQRSKTPEHLRDDVSMSMSATPGPTQVPESFPRQSSSSLGLDAPPSSHNQPGPEEPEHQAESTVPCSVNPQPDFSTARILLAKVGLASVDLLKASFELDERLVAAARRWAQRAKHYDPSEVHMRLYLTSIPTTAAEAAYHELPADFPPSLLAETVSKIDIVWPRPGSFYVSLNMETPEAVSWGDHFFTASSPALDLSNAVVPGKNHIQFVQLADQSQWLFLVIAIPPSEHERQQALVVRSRQTAWNQISHDHRPAKRIKLRLDTSI